jgi:hypothetical protein
MIPPKTVNEERAGLNSLVEAVVSGQLDGRHVNRESVLLSLVLVMRDEVREESRAFVDAVLGCLPSR